MILLLVPFAALSQAPRAPYYSLQVASATSEAEALAALGKLREVPDARIESRGAQYAVRIGAWPQRESAVQALEHHRANGWTNAFVVHVQSAVPWTLAATSPPPGAAGEGAGATAVRVAMDTPEPRPAARERKPPAAPASAAAPPPDPGLRLERWWETAHVRLEDLGWQDGLVLEGATGSRDVYLPIPSGANAQKARVTLNLRYGESLIGESTLLLSVNGVPRRTLRRADAGPAGVVQVDLPLQARDLRGPFVHLRFDYTQLADRDICFSEVLAGAWTRIEPDSGLDVAAGELPPTSVGAAWSLLPQEVAIAADFSSLDADEFQALFRLASRLRAEGRSFRLQRLIPGTPLQEVPAHIVLAEPGVTEAAIPRGNAYVAHSGNRALLVLERGSGAAAVRTFSRSAGDAAGAGRADAAHASAPAPKSRDSLRLSELGFAEGERRFSRSTRWDIPMPFGALGPALRPDWAQLEVYAPDLGGPERHTVLTAYYNDRLVYSGALSGKGAPQSVGFALPRHLLRARNQLSIVAQRAESAGDCSSAAAPQPISISPASRILLKPLADVPETFAELVPHEGNLKIHLPDTALHAAPQVIPFLVAAGAHFWPSAAPPEIRFFGPEEPFLPDSPFLVVGQPKWEPQAPVMFDQGRVRILTAAARQEFAMLEMQPNSDWALLQMAQAAGQAGAWVMTGGGYEHLPSTGLLLEDEDVALLDRGGVQVALRVGPTRDYEVTYPDANSWFDAAGRMRVLLFIAAWLMIATLVVYLLRASRRNRGAARNS